MTDDQLKVAIVSGSLSRAAGGILPIMQQHAVALRELGVEVTAHGVGYSAQTDDRAGWGRTPISAHHPWVAAIAYAPGLARSLKQADSHVVHQHGLWQYPSIAVSSWRRRVGGPVVISTQGMLEPWALSNSRVKKKIAAALFERRNLSMAAVIHCSRAEVSGVRAFGLKNPIAVLPNGAVVPDAQHRPSRPAFLPHEGRRTLLFLGRLHPKKGISETLAAFARLKQLAPSVASGWRLAVAGWDDGGHAARFRCEADALQLTNDVLFLGPIFGEDKAAALAHADAFVLASHSEGFPMAVLEAWANALPVFKTRECNIPEGFEADAAIEVTTDSDAFAARLAEHLPRPDLIDVGRRGKAMVVNRFSWPVIAKQLRDVYLWTLGRAPKPECILS